MNLLKLPEPDWSCGRCGWKCPHLDGMAFYCPNCGPPKPVPGDPRHVTYEGALGCKSCGRPPGPNLNDPKVIRKMKAYWNKRIAAEKRARIADLKAEIARLKAKP